MEGIRMILVVLIILGLIQTVFKQELTGNVLNETTEILSQIRGNVTEQINRVDQLTNNDLMDLDIDQLSDMLQDISN